MNRAGFFIANTAVALVVQLIQMNLALIGLGRGERLHGNRDQAEANRSLPHRPECHMNALSSSSIWAPSVADQSILTRCVLAVQAPCLKTREI